jgi:hypothetical protein
MTLGALPRRLATFLLRLALRITPRESLDWGQAMLNELHHVTGDWAALNWAIGGTVVLARHALLAMIIPPRKRQMFPLGEDLFDKESFMSKTLLAAAGACVTAALLFFLAPTFRQGFRVSLTQWHQVLNVTASERQPSLEALARRAEERRDAEGLAFVAVRHWEGSESARLVEEAVRIDPKLIWVYAIVAVRNPDRPEIQKWIPNLEEWDPQNALPHLIGAESVDIDQVVHEKVPHSLNEESSAWKNALAAAFRSPRLDNYLDRLKALDRRVVISYRFDDPSQAIDGDLSYGLPTYTAWDSSRYAKSVLDSAEELETRGDTKGAAETYWAVARFGQMLAPSLGYGNTLMGKVLRETYERLGALSEKEGKYQQALLCANLSEKIAQEEKDENILLRERDDSANLSRWNANVVKVSGFALLLFGVVVLICAVVVRFKAVRLSSPRSNNRLTITLGLISSVGLLMSSAALYMSYRPYAEIFQQFIRTGSESQLRELSQFLAYTRMPLGVQGFHQLRDFVFYFWFGITAICVASVLLLLARRFNLWRLHRRTS